MNFDQGKSVFKSMRTKQHQTPQLVNKGIAHHKQLSAIISREPLYTNKTDRSNTPDNDHHLVKTPTQGQLVLPPHIQNRKQQELLESLAKDYSFDGYNRNINQQKTIRHQDLQPVESIQRHFSQRQLYEQHQFLSKENTELNSTVMEMENTIKDKDDVINKVTHLYFQEKEKSDKLIAKIQSVCSLILSKKLKNDLLESKQESETLRVFLKDLKSEYEHKLDDLRKRFEKVSNNYEMMKDLQQTSELNKNELQHVIMQKDNKIMELTQKIYELEHSTRFHNSFNEKDESHSKSKILVDMGWDSNSKSSLSVDLPEQHKHKLLVLDVQEKNKQLVEKDELIKSLNEKINKLTRQLSDSKAKSQQEWNKLKEQWEQLFNEYQTLQDQMKIQQKPQTTSESELRTQNLELKDKLCKATSFLDEIQATQFDHYFQPQISPREPAVSTISKAKYSDHQKPTQMLQSQKYSQMMKSPSINSLGSCLSHDKRQTMDRFNKLTAATVGMMSTYMDYQSLNNFCKQAEYTLKNAHIDISQSVARRKNSSQDVHLDGN